MMEIKLSRGMVALVDDDDWSALAVFKWYAHRGLHTFYAARYDNSGKLEYMHRRILKAQTGEKVDHVNQNGLDCQRHNIRICTSSQNHMNKTKRRAGSSKYKGVCWSKCARKWQAQIQCDGKQFHLGLFNDDIIAARTYDSKARELFGEFAKCNFPQEPQ
jgi:hypothetical protein